MPRLELQNMTVHAGKRCILDQINLTLHSGEIVALVGASGSGKSMTVKAMLGTIPVEPGRVSGRLVVTLQDTIHAPYDESDPEFSFQKLRGRIIGPLPQEARQSLDPLWTVQQHIDAAIDDKSQTMHVLSQAGFGSPERVMRLYPHELSGGMAQRVSIAIALAQKSMFLLADEPTTGLDPSIQSGILNKLVDLKNTGIGILLITHDLRLIPRLADRVLLLHKGSIVDRVDGNDLSHFTSQSGKQLLESTRRITGSPL